MSEYYKRLLEQRGRVQKSQIFQKWAIFGVIILAIAGISYGAYYYFSHRSTIAVGLVNQEVKVQVAPEIENKTKASLEKFAADHKELKLSCDQNCQKPDILFAIKKDENYKYSELVGKVASSKATYKFKPPDRFILSGTTEIWLMSQTEGKLIEDLKNYLKKDFSNEKITVNFVGDIMLSRTVDQKIAEAANFNLPFLKMASFLKEADITCGNLESPFYDQGGPIRSGMVFKADPKSISGLKYAGLDIVTLANNHFGNQGTAGMLYTFSHLQKNSIDYIGAGKNLAEAEKYQIKEVNGVKIAFIGVENYSITPGSYHATPIKPGILHVEADKISKYVKKAKSKADVVVVTFHGGTEYAPKANQQQIDFAHAAIDSGADIVIGHHPHVVQNVEVYRGKMILYSLGNFVFDQMWSAETQQGLVAQVTFEGSLLSEIKLVPVHIYNYCQPQKCLSGERNTIIQRILSNSDL